MGLRVPGRIRNTLLLLVFSCDLKTTSFFKCFHYVFTNSHVCYNIVLHCQRLWFTPHEAVQSQGSHNITINFYDRYPARREVHLPSESKQLKGKCYQETELSLTLPCCLSFIPASDTQSWITALVVIRFRSSGRPVTLHSRKHFIITRGWQRLVQMQLIKAVRFFSSFGQWRVMQRNSLHIFTSVTTDRFFSTLAARLCRRVWNISSATGQTVFRHSGSSQDVL